LIFNVLNLIEYANLKREIGDANGQTTNGQTKHDWIINTDENE
jgi:hypothetical protein